MVRPFLLLGVLVTSPAWAEGADPRPLLDALLRAADNGASEVSAGKATIEDGVFRLDLLVLSSGTERVVLEGIVATGARVDDAGRFRADTVRVDATSEQEFEPSVILIETTDIVLDDVVLDAGSIALDAPPLAWMATFGRASTSGSRYADATPGDAAFEVTTGAETVSIEKTAPGNTVVESTMRDVAIDFSPWLPDAGVEPGALVLRFDVDERRTIRLGRGTLSIEAEFASDGLGTARLAAEFHGIGEGEVDLLGLVDDRPPPEWPDGVQLWRLEVTLDDAGGVAALKRLSERMGMPPDEMAAMAADRATAAGPEAAGAVARFLADGGSLHLSIEPPAPRSVRRLTTLPVAEVIELLRPRVEASRPAE